MGVPNLSDIAPTSNCTLWSWSRPRDGQWRCLDQDIYLTDLYDFVELPQINFVTSGSTKL